jgi:hypothetical protein
MGNEACCVREMPEDGFPELAILAVEKGEEVELLPAISSQI